MTLLKKIRPVLSFEDNYMITRLGSYARAFEITLPCAFTMTEEKYVEMSDKWSQIFRRLPAYTIVHKMDVFCEDIFVPKTKEKETALYTSYKEKFNERKKMVHKCYLFIAKGDVKIKGNDSSLSSIFKRKIISKSKIDSNLISEFDNAIKIVKAMLNESNYFSLRDIDAEEWVDICGQYESLNFQENSPKFSADINQDDDGARIGNEYISSVALNDIAGLPAEYPDFFKHPNYISPRSSMKFSLFYSVGLDLAFNHIVNQIWIVEDIDDLKKDLESQDSWSNLVGFADKSNFQNVEDNSEFTELMDGEYLPVRYHANVLLWNKDREVLEDRLNSTLAAFSRVKITPNIANKEVLPLYWSCYPGNAYDIGYADQTFLLLDRQSSCLNVFETADKDDKSEFGMYFGDRISSCPIFVDVSDLPMKKGITNNRNKMIFGPSGSGKSVLCNLMVENYLDYNTDVVIVDVGDSYKRLAELNNATYLTYTEDNPISFNPFVLKEGELTVEKKESLVSLVKLLWIKENEVTSKADDVFISNSITQFFSELEKHKSYRPCFDSYYLFLKKIFIPQFLREGKGDLVKTDSLLYCLEPFYVGGDYHYLLNSNKKESFLEDPFVVFELDNIKDHKVLFPVVTLMIMDTFIAKMRLRKGRRKVILIEEAWKAIANAGMAEFLRYLYKTVRKHFGEAILVTQEVEDVLGSEIIKNAVIKNCGAKFLLDMREYANDFDKIQAMLSLDQNAKEQILSLNLNNSKTEYYKEVTLVLGNTARTLQVNISPVQYATFTTEKPEIEIIENYRKKYDSLEMAIQLYGEDVKLKWKNNAA